MKVDCRKFEESLAAFVDRELAAGDIDAFEQHWRDCDACGLAFAELFEEDLAVDLRPEQSEQLWMRIEAGLDRTEGDVAHGSLNQAAAQRLPTKSNGHEAMRAAPTLSPRAKRGPKASSALLLFAAAAALIASLVFWGIPGDPPIEPIVKVPPAEDDGPAVIVEHFEVGEGYSYFVNHGSSSDGVVSIIICQAGD